MAAVRLPRIWKLSVNLESETYDMERGNSFEGRATRNGAVRAAGVNQIGV
jgi:hypothetical protein